MYRSRRLDILAVGPLKPHGFGGMIGATNALNALAERGHSVRAVAPVPESETNLIDSYDQKNHPLIDMRRFSVPLVPKIWFQEIDGRQSRTIRSIVKQQFAERRPDVVVVTLESFAAGIDEAVAEYDVPWAAWIQYLRSVAALSDFPASEIDSILKSINKADLRIACAHNLAHWLEEHCPGPVVSLPNGVDVEQFSPGSGKQSLREGLGISTNDLVVIHVSSLKPIKRVEDLIAAARVTVIEEPRLRFLLVGDSWHRSALENAHAESGVGERLVFAGLKEHGAVADYLRLADVFVMTSSAECLPLAGLEAMACRLPVLLSDVPGLREISGDGRAGILFRCGDITDLAEKILRLTADPELRSALGGKARDHVLRHHDFRAQITGFEEVLTQLADTGVSNRC